MKIEWRQTLGLLSLAAMVAVTVGCQSQQTKPKRAEPVEGLQSVYFDFDRSDIKSEYKATLDNNSSWMNDHSKANVVVEGNCDQRGSVEYNIALGWRRARSAKNYLVSSGVSADRLATKSFGKENLVCTETVESCYWKNRRADFKAK